MKLKFYTTLILGVLLCLSANGQDFAIKSNLLYDATATINVSFELPLDKKWTLDISGDYNSWNMSGDKKWKHWMIQPEARYWFCDRFGGHFLGFHAHGGKYNIGGIDGGTKFLGTDFSKLADHRYQGWYVGAGVAYGYAWVLGKHWNLEGEIGVGYSYTRYDRFECMGCGKKVETDKPHHYVGLTKTAINLVYLF